MNYEERILAYIDILGFKDAVNCTVEKTNEKEIEKIYEIEKINNLLDEEQFQLNIKECLLGETRIKGKVTSQFSDLIVISYLKENFVHDILLDVYFLCAMALEKGFLFRGAIVCGKAIHTENKICGPALINAYNIEKCKAVFPRIIIDEDILVLAKRNYSKCDAPDTEYKNLMEIIKCDFDGLYYINYIDKLYTGVNVGDKAEQEHRMLICEIIEKMKEKFNSDVNIKYKYLWLKEKFEKSRANL